MADRQAHEHVGQCSQVLASHTGPADVDSLDKPSARPVDERGALGGDKRKQAGCPVVREQQPHERVIVGDGQEPLEGGGQSRDGITPVLVDRVLDFVQKATALPNHEGLAELIPAAELVVQGLAADAGGGRDLSHRRLGPGAIGERIATRVEKPVAEELADGAAIGRAHPPGP